MVFKILSNNWDKNNLNQILILFTFVQNKMNTVAHRTAACYNLKAIVAIYDA